MYRTVLHDYRYHIKEGFKGLDLGAWVIYVCVIADGGLLTHDFERFIAYETAMLPLVFGLLLSQMYGGRMSQTFFLCPLSAEDRKNYMRTGMKLRFMMAMGLFLLLNLPTVFGGLLSFPVFGAKLVVMLVAALSFNIHCQPRVINSRTAKRVYPFAGNYEFYNITAQVLGICNMMLLSFWEENEHLWELILMTVLILAQIYVAVRMVKKFYAQIIEQAVCFETVEQGN